jgi:hypothetical protein
MEFGYFDDSSFSDSQIPDWFADHPPILDEDKFDMFTSVQPDEGPVGPVGPVADVDPFARFENSDVVYSFLEDNTTHTSNHIMDMMNGFANCFESSLQAPEVAEAYYDLSESSEEEQPIIITKKVKPPKVVKVVKKRMLEQSDKPCKKSKAPKFGKFTNIWTSLTCIDNVTVQPTKVPAEMFKHREHFQLARAYCQHVPNQWILRSDICALLSASVSHSARGTLINKKNSLATTTPWPEMKPGFKCLDNELYIAKFNKAWVFCYLAYSEQNIGNCPMPSGFSCPFSASCPK